WKICRMAAIILPLCAVTLAGCSHKSVKSSSEQNLTRKAMVDQEVQRQLDDPIIGPALRAYKADPAKYREVLGASVREGRMTQRELDNHIETLEMLAKELP